MRQRCYADGWRPAALALTRWVTRHAGIVDPELVSPSRAPEIGVDDDRRRLLLRMPLLLRRQRGSLPPMRGRRLRQDNGNPQGQPRSRAEPAGCRRGRCKPACANAVAERPLNTQRRPRAVPRPARGLRRASRSTDRCRTSGSRALGLSDGERSSCPSSWSHKPRQPLRRVSHRPSKRAVGASGMLEQAISGRQSVPVGTNGTLAAAQAPDRPARTPRARPVAGWCPQNSRYFGFAPSRTRLANWSTVRTSAAVTGMAHGLPGQHENATRLSHPLRAAGT